LEIGVGTGKNIPHYPPDSRVIGVDFSEEMLKRAEAKARKLRPGVELMLMDVESLGFDAERFDAVVATFVFCSVPDPIKGLNEVRRVLKPNGRFYALEHVRPKGYFLGRLFDDFAPAVFARTGVHINRNTAENIRNAGFDIESEKKYMFDIVKMIVARPKFRLHDREVRA
jgi:ubiquinone/menaquinone biosynthesis C-methylase UbiE